METIQSVLDNYFASWNEGFISKNGAAIKQFMSSKLLGYWAHSNIDEPEVYGFDYDIDDVLKQTNDATKSFEISSITSRKNGLEFLIFRKRNEFNKRYPLLCTMYVYLAKRTAILETIPGIYRIRKMISTVIYKTV